MVYALGSCSTDELPLPPFLWPMLIIYGKAQTQSLVPQDQVSQHNY